MSAEPNFQVVDDRLREGRTGNRSKRADTQAVLDGKTIFIPLNGKTSSQLSSSWASRIANGSKRSMSCRSYTTEVDGVRGLVVWAIPKDAA